MNEKVTSVSKTSVPEGRRDGDEELTIREGGLPPPNERGSSPTSNCSELDGTVPDDESCLRILRVKMVVVGKRMVNIEAWRRGGEERRPSPVP